MHRTLAFVAVPDGALLAPPWGDLAVDAPDCGALASPAAPDAPEAADDETDEAGVPVPPPWHAVSPKAAMVITAAAAALRTWRSAARCDMVFRPVLWSAFEAVLTVRGRDCRALLVIRRRPANSSLTSAARRRTRPKCRRCRRAVGINPSQSFIPAARRHQ
ncbi:hypothetical protein GCM10009864_06210 [Streptomyces lunalinharesii]|uniref:Secreted protein n=1 Tax=Streptomyces lunalinharesii TaxID=333384 RepID=A0ABP6DQ68_9ACTN